MGVMTLEITVRGSAELRYPAERAIVSLVAAIEGPDKQQAFAEAVAIQDPLTQQLSDLADRGAVTSWSSEQVRVFSHRPWLGDGQRGDLTHVARLDVSAEFTDFERLSGFIDYWAGRDGVEVGSIRWDVTPRHRRSYESEARKAAVDDAVSKAQAYADAVRRGRVRAVQLADPGMLDGQAEHPPELMRMATSVDGAGPEGGLELTPDEIVIYVAVDARFTAE
jgi:uncharacterized protein YggE